MGIYGIIKQKGDRFVYKKFNYYINFDAGIAIYRLPV